VLFRKLKTECRGLKCRCNTSGLRRKAAAYQPGAGRGRLGDNKKKVSRMNITKKNIEFFRREYKEYKESETMDWEKISTYYEREAEKWYGSYEEAIKQAEREKESLEEELAKAYRALEKAIEVIVSNNICTQDICQGKCTECWEKKLLEES